MSLAWKDCPAKRSVPYSSRSRKWRTSASPSKAPTPASTCCCAVRRRDNRPSFSVIDYTVAVANPGRRAGSPSEATIKVEVGDQTYHEVAEGNGPVNALMLALRKAIHGYFPQLDRMHLLDYKVRILNSDQGTGASVRVLITSSDGARNWTTVGASTNIIEGQLDGDIRRSRILPSSPSTSRNSQVRLPAARISVTCSRLADEAHPGGTPVHAGDNRSAELTSAG